MLQKKKRKLTGGKIAAIVLAVVAFMLAAALLITNIFIPVKYLSTYFSYGKDKHTAGSMRVSFIDVGNSECTIVEFPDGKTLLIDGGDGTYKHNLKIMEELNVRGIEEIDFLVLTSVADESAGGLAEILGRKTVNKAFVPYCPLKNITVGYKKFAEAADKLNLETDICEYGVGYENTEEGYFFGFLSPDAHTAEGGEYKNMISNPSDNNIKEASAVMWIEYGGTSFLLSASVGKKVQNKLIDNYSFNDIYILGNKVDLSSCDVLKLSDHGSSSSAYSKFTDLLDPSTAIISVGENRRGNPDSLAISNIQKHVGEKVFRTDEFGTVIVSVSGGSYKTFKEKK